MPKGHGFPVASKILKRDDQDRAFKLHRQRMQNISSKLDNSPPRRYPHLVLRLKQTQMEEEYLANVDYENKMLLHKMVRIMEKPRNGMDNWNDYETKSLNAPYKSKREVRIEQENLAMARRLEAVRPMYSTGKWEEEHRRYKYLQDMWSDSTKDYTPRGRGRDRHSVNGSKADDDQYEDDFESDDETGREGENGRLPDIKQDKDNRDTRRSKSDSSVQRLPKIQNKKQNPKLYMYWGKYFNADFEESEDGKPSQAEQDAKQLFRVAKTLVPPTDIMVRTLIRRTPKQRDIIKKKFHELYELDLTSELKNGLGKQWHLLIESLLPASRDNDDGGDVHNGKEDDDDGPESALQSALQKGDIATVVAIIASKTDKDLADLKDSYDRKHGTTLENDIKARTQDPEQLFLVNLTKVNKSGGKKDVVQREATAIFEQENERWTSPDGEFMKVVERRTPAHVKAVLKKYEEVSGTSALKAIKQECSKNYADAVAALLSDSSKGEELGTQGMNHAIVMYKNLNAENPTFVNLLVERAEIDMPTVRKAYSKKYKSEMHVDLDDRSRHPTVRCLVELILKVPPGKEKEQDKHGSQQKRSKSEYRKGSQEGNQGQGQNKDSPFGKNSRRAMAESRKEQPKKKKSGEDNAEKLHNAIQKKQLTAKLTLDVLLEGNNAKRQALKKKYKEKYKTDLAEDLKKELSGDDLEDVVVGLLMSPTEYDAYCLNKAVMGLGTNEDVLIGILCTASPKELKSIKETYKKNYGEDLDSAIKGDTSGGFEDMLLALSRGEREQGTNVNDKQAKEVAQKLAKNKTLDMDDPTFTELMTKTNKEQLKATFREYKKVSGRSMEQAIKSASSGDKEDGYLGLLAATDDPVTFYADSLQKACKGAGTNDDQLMRIVISRSEVDLPAIKAKFKDRHKRPLRQAIEDETSGEYRDALLKIVDKTGKSNDRRGEKERQKKDDGDNMKDKHDEENTVDVTEATTDAAESTPSKTDDDHQANPTETASGNPTSFTTAHSKRTENDKSDGKTSRSEEKPSKDTPRTSTTKRADDTERGKTTAKQAKGRGRRADGKGNKSTTQKEKDRDSKPKDTTAAEPEASQKQNGDKLQGVEPDRTESTVQEEKETGQEENKEKGFDADEDAVKLRNAMKGLGTDEKAIIKLITSRTADQRQKVRQAFADKYNQDLMLELDSELSGDFGTLTRDLVRLPWERELQALIGSMAGMGTNEQLLVHVLLTHTALPMAELSKKYKEAEDKALEDAVESETSGNFHRLLQALLKKKDGSQGFEKEWTADEVARKLHSGGKNLLQAREGGAIDVLMSCPADKMADVLSSYRELSGRHFQEDIKEHMSGDAEDALLSYVAYTSDPHAYEVEAFRKSLAGESTFCIFSLIICSNEEDLQTLELRYQAYTGSPLKDAVDKELTGDVRSLVLGMLARDAPEGDGH